MTNDFELKEWSLDYADDFAYHANNMNIARNLRDVFPHPYKKEDAVEYITACMNADPKKQFCYAIVKDGEAIGSIGAFVQNDVARRSAEIGYWLSEDFWNQGIMGEAVLSLCNKVFQESDVVRIYAEVFAYNIPSQKVLKRAGFQQEGVLKKSVFKCGELHDSCMYALIKE